MIKVNKVYLKMKFKFMHIIKIINNKNKTIYKVMQVVQSVNLSKSYRIQSKKIKICNKVNNLNNNLTKNLYHSGEAKVMHPKILDKTIKFNNNNFNNSIIINKYLLNKIIINSNSKCKDQTRKIQ